ncbi:MAG: nuclear transport factor 2 family protein [Bdellovibrionota bacterium]
MENRTDLTTNTFEATSRNSRAEVEAFLDRFKQVFVKGDVEGVISFYDKDVIAYDMVPPLEFQGLDAYADSWRKNGGQMPGPWLFETKDERIYCESELAVVHHLVNCGATGPDGKMMSGWIRHTMTLRRRAGEWTIVHDHFSVPVDMKANKALMDLKPETATH